MTLRSLLLLLVLAALSGCGAPLADTSYEGEALLTLEGTVRYDSIPVTDGPMRLAIFWARHGVATPGGRVSTVEQAGLTRGFFPARFALSIYTPPPDDVLVPADGAGRYALGLLGAYIDVDQNAHFSADRDLFVGGAVQSAVLWVPEGAADSSFGSLGAGFHLLAFEEPAERCANGRVQFEEHPVALALEIRIDATHPAASLLDLDCDGDVGEFTQVCPAEGVTARCGHACGTPEVATCEFAFCCADDPEHNEHGAETETEGAPGG